MKLFQNDKTASPLNRAEALACIPVISTLISWHQQDNGDILIEYPLPVNPFLQALFQRFHKQQPEKLTRKLQLDTMGSKVWQMIDGKQSVKMIIEGFATESSITLHEAELSVTKFIRELGKRGLISLH